jgi:hypothetical protein
MRRPAILIATLAVLGLVAAAGIGLLVNEVSGDSIGLGAEPLSATPLAPPEAAEEAAERRRDRKQELRESIREQVERVREQLQELHEQQQAVTPPTGDDASGDHGGEDNSGSGSDDSGSGSDDSGDEVEFEDD